MSEGTKHNGSMQDIALLNRRDFLRTAGRTVGGIALGGALAGATSAFAQEHAVGTAAAAKSQQAETLVKTLFDSLTPEQTASVCMPWEHTKRSMVQANWGIVKTTIGKQFNADQQEMIKGILKGLTTEEWYPKILQQMEGDAGGFRTTTRRCSEPRKPASSSLC